MKYLFQSLLFCSLFTTLACRQAPVKKTATEQEAWVRAYFESFNRHEWLPLSNMYADSITVRDPSLGSKELVQTREEVFNKYKVLEKEIPDVKDHVQKVYATAEGDVIVEFISTGTGPDKKPFELPICTIFSFENGKIVKDLTYYNNPQ